MALSACVWFTVGMCTSSKPAGAQHDFFTCACICVSVTCNFLKCILSVCQLCDRLLWQTANLHRLSLSSSLFSESFLLKSIAGLFCMQENISILSCFKEAGVWNNTASCLYVWDAAFVVSSKGYGRVTISYRQLFSGHFPRHRFLQHTNSFLFVAAPLEILIHLFFVFIFFMTKKIHPRAWSQNGEMCRLIMHSGQGCALWV